ncbi:MAG: hypothetical protein ACM3SM_16020 [Bacteroidota bacterium]
MLSFDEIRKVNTDFTLIQFDEVVILEVDEPVLFTGINKYGNRILASIIEDDVEVAVSSFFHLIVKSKEYLSFLNGKITYRDLIKQSPDIFIVQRPFSGGKPAIYNVLLEEIPEEYLPLENSYCPKMESEYGLEYVLSLKGRLADRYMATVSEVNHIQSTFAHFFTKSFKLFKDMKVKPAVYLKPVEAGSFRLNYSIQLDKGMFPDESEISRFLTTYLEYCINYLPDQVDIIFSSETPDTLEYKLLKQQIEKIYNIAAIPQPPQIDQLIKEEITCGASTINDISDSLGQNFSEIELLNSSHNGPEYPIGIIDLNYKKKIADTLNIIEKKSNLISSDTIFNEYEIYIYNLNLETRNGNAIITRDNEELDRPRITILGDSPLDNTKYTESLYRNKKIKVSAKASRIKDKFRALEIEYEDTI